MSKVIQMKPKPQKQAKVIAVPEPHNGEMKRIQQQFNQLQASILDAQLKFTIESQNGALEAGLSRKELNLLELLQNSDGNWEWKPKQETFNES